MKTPTKWNIRRLCLVAGVCLLVVAGLVLVIWQWGIYSSAEKAQDYVQTIRSLIPEPQGAALEQRRDNTMPALSVEGTDFVGILEMPRYQSSLPVGGHWGSVSKYPCHFSGSVYERTLQIGATSQKGQYDFYREISVGDELYYTDMEGNRYTYVVRDIHYENHADQEAMQQQGADLILFIKNVYALEYVIVYCDALS